MSAHLNDRIAGLSCEESRELRRLIWVAKPTLAFRPAVMRRLLDKGLARMVRHHEFEPTDEGHAAAAAVHLSRRPPDDMGLPSDSEASS